MAEKQSDEPSAIGPSRREPGRRRPLGEHVVSLIKAGLATTPFAGGIASLLSDYIPSARERRIEEFAKRLAEDLQRLRERVDEDYLRTDDFAFMFEKCFRAAAENPQEEKLSAFQNILVNSTLRGDLSEQEKEYFLNLAARLTTLHIRILRFMAEPEAYLESVGISPDQIRGGFKRFFPVAIPGVPLDVIISAYGELYRDGLVKTDKTIFGTMTSAQGLALLKGRLSELGQRFVSFVSQAA